MRRASDLLPGPATCDPLGDGPAASGLPSCLAAVPALPRPARPEGGRHDVLLHRASETLTALIRTFSPWIGSIRQA
jgi:hypothetical protein